MNTVEQSTTYSTLRSQFRCDHTDKRLTRRIIADGRERAEWQCCRCGHSGGAASARGIDLATLPAWDETLRTTWDRRERQAFDEAWQAEQDAKNQAWRARYNAYLESDHWRHLRQQVFDRDKWTCQGCLQKVNTYSAECHHLSYVGLNRVGYSFGFECITLCRRCHRDYHSED